MRHYATVGGETMGDGIAGVVPYGIARDLTGTVRWAARCPGCAHIVVGRAEFLHLHCMNCGAELVIAMPAGTTGTH